MTLLNTIISSSGFLWIKLATLIALAALFFIFVKKQLHSRKIAMLLSSLLLASGILYETGILGPLVKYLDRFVLKVGPNELHLLSLLKSFSLVAVLVWGALFIGQRLDRKLDHIHHMQPSMRLLFSKLAKIFMVTLSIYVGLSIVGIDLSIFAFFAGALGVGIAFGIQNIFSNFFCGLILLFDRSIKPGDVISINDGKTYGVVHKLHARFVSLRTREGKEHLVPNEQFISNKLENWSFSDPFVRMEIPFSVAFDTDLELIEKLLLEVAHKTSRIVEKPAPHVRYKSLLDHRVDLELRFWIKDPQNGMSSIQSHVIFAAWKAFKEHGIKVPYPQRELLYDHVGLTPKDFIKETTHSKNS